MADNKKTYLPETYTVRHKDFNPSAPVGLWTIEGKGAIHSSRLTIIIRTGPGIRLYRIEKKQGCLALLGRIIGT